MRDIRFFVFKEQLRKDQLSMKKRTLFLWMVLFSGIISAQTASAQTVSAQINENEIISTCANPISSTCTACFNSFSFNLVWTRTPAPAGYQWSPIMLGGPAGSNGMIVGQGSSNQGSKEIYSHDGGKASPSCNQWIHIEEQRVNSAQWTVWGYLYAPDGSKTLVKSNIAQLSNPFSS